MGMGLVNDAEFESQLSNVTRTINKSDPSVIGPDASDSVSIPPVLPSEIIEQPSKGRKEGDNNVPSSLRNLIGITANTEGRAEALAIAKMFGVSSSSVSAYANGASSTKTYNQPKVDILSVITKSKNRLTKKALLKLGTSLDGINEQSMNGLDALQLSNVAKNMSAVVKNMEPDLPANGNGPNVLFQIYAPTIRDEATYDSIRVNDV